MSAGYMVQVGARVQYVMARETEAETLAAMGAVIGELRSAGVEGPVLVTPLADDGSAEAPASEPMPATEAAPEPMRPTPPMYGPRAPEPMPPMPKNSTWAEQVTDDAAKARIEAQHAALVAAGVQVDASQQLYATGTRMADEGYASQDARKAAHEASPLLTDAAHALDKAVRDERREDVTCSARELAAKLTVNGRVAVDGLTMGEQAIRGLVSQLGSPSLGYVLGVRDRIQRELSRPEAERNHAAIQDDKRTIHAVLVRECLRAPETALKLRTRRGPGDIFAIVSPSYAPADVTDGVLAQILRELPSDARGTWTYDPTSTTWELRAEVWTPTPTDEQAVGEAFKGYVSFRSADNGTSRFRGGGGIELLRCLNASTYTSDGTDVSRVHRGRILYDIDTMVAGSLRAIAALALAWGQARQDVIPLPARVTIEDAIPGFYRSLLRGRGDLVGVLPGRTEGHVAGLASAFHAERRDATDIVRADLAQGWTRYIQGQPAPVRRDAEAAIGQWMVRAPRVGYEARS